MHDFSDDQLLCLNKVIPCKEPKNYWFAFPKVLETENDLINISRIREKERINADNDLDFFINQTECLVR